MPIRILICWLFIGSFIYSSDFKIQTYLAQSIYDEEVYLGFGANLSFAFSKQIGLKYVSEYYFNTKMDGAKLYSFAIYTTEGNFTIYSGYSRYKYLTPIDAIDIGFDIYYEQKFIGLELAIPTSKAEEKKRSPIFGFKFGVIF